MHNKIIYILPILYFSGLLCNNTINFYCAPQINFLKLKNIPFHQSSSLISQFDFNKIVSCPSLKLGLEYIQPLNNKKKIKLGFGLKGIISKKDHTSEGLVTFKDDTNVPAYIAFQEFGFKAFGMYWSLIGLVKSFNLQISAGLLLANDILGDTKFHENNSNKPYSGIKFKTREGKNTAYQFSCGISKEFRDQYYYGLHLEYTRGKQYFDHKVYIEEPSLNATTYLQKIHLLGGDPVYLYDNPKTIFKILSLSFVVGFEI